MPPWLGMPSPGEALLGWSEIEWLWKIPDAILEKGEQVFTQYGVPEIWQQIVGQVAYSTSKVDAATRGIAPNMVLNTKDGPKSLDEQARSSLGP